MKMKFTILSSAALLISSMASAQTAPGTDTLLWENFENDPSGYTTYGAPSGVTNEANWTDFDADGLPDGSTANRPGDWFWTLGFSTVDSSSGVYASNAWTNNSTTPVQNYLMTPAIQIVDNSAVLSWKSAPYQTPLYLDGYVVLISTSTNLEPDFTDTVFVASEYVSHNNASDSTYSSFTFSPSNGYVHGMNGQYIEYSGDSLRFTGILEPHSVSLSSYAGQHIYVAFVHNSHDDNLLSLDEILIKGTSPNSIREFSQVTDMNLYPNPASGNVNVKYTLGEATPVIIDMYDINGKLVRTASKGFQAAGEYNYSFSTDYLAHGYYNVVVRTASGSSTKRLMVK